MARLTPSQARTNRLNRQAQRRALAATRYTRPQVIAALADYRPRKATYKDARTHLLALAA